MRDKGTRKLRVFYRSAADNKDYIKRLLSKLLIVHLMFFTFYPFSEVKAEISIPKPEYDGNSIQIGVILKTNPPTSTEEIEAARAYDAEQKKIAAAKKRSVQSQKTSAAVYKKVKVSGYSACSCVSYARWKTGINVGPIGLAKYHPINHSTPIVGAIGVMKYNAFVSGHLFAVGAVEATRMWIDESNWSKCKVTGRWVPLTYGEGFYY